MRVCVCVCERVCRVSYGGGGGGGGDFTKRASQEDQNDANFGFIAPSTME